VTEGSECGFDEFDDRLKKKSERMKALVINVNRVGGLAFCFRAVEADVCSRPF